MFGGPTGLFKPLLKACRLCGFCAGSTIWGLPKIGDPYLVPEVVG